MHVYHFAKHCSNVFMELTIDEIRAKNYEFIRGKSGLNKGAFALSLGCDPSYMSQVLSKKTKRNMGDEVARQIELAIGKKKGWMDNPHWDEGDAVAPVTGEKLKIESNGAYLGEIEEWDSNTPLDEDEVALPFFREVELAAGNGRHQVQENHGCKLRFSKSTLKRQGVSVDSAYCVTVSGNSMEPMMPDGSVIGIDTSVTAIKNGDIYAIDHNGHLRVKVLYRMPDNRIRLRSLNSDEWPDEYVGGEELNAFKVLGRVFYGSWLR